MGVAVRTNSIGGEERSGCVPIKSVRFSAMIKPQGIRRSEIDRGADFDPTIIRLRRSNRWRSESPCGQGRGQFSSDVIGGVQTLPEGGRNDFAPGGEQSRIGLGHVALHQLMKFWQGVIRNQREHVVLHMVIHVPIKEAVERIHLDRAAVQPVIQDVLRESRVLRKSVNQHQPTAVEVQQPDIHQRQNAVPIDSGRDRRAIDQEIMRALKYILGNSLAGM